MAPTFLKCERRLLKHGLKMIGNVKSKETVGDIFTSR